MTLDDFRRIALSMPGAEESQHFGNPDFRVKGKIFATLGGTTGKPMVKLTPDEQAMLVEAEPAIFTPVEGYWGKKGATRLDLAHCDEAALADALQRAWRNVSEPKRRKK